MYRFGLGILALSLVATAVPVNADHATFSTSGSFLVGSPFDYLFRDACFASPSELQDGISSSCASLGEEDFSGHAYELTYTDATGTAEAAACFFSGTRYISCPSDGIVPDGADRVSVSSLGGLNIEWSITIG